MMAMGYVPYALSELFTEHEPEYASECSFCFGVDDL